MKKLFLIICIVLSITMISFSDVSNREIFFNKIKITFGYSENEVNEFMKKTSENDLAIYNLQKEYANIMTSFASEEEYTQINNDNKFVAFLPEILKYLNKQLDESDKIVSQIEVYYSENCKETDLLRYLDLQNNYREIDYKEFVYVDNIQGSVLSDIIDYYYIKYFVQKYSDTDDKPFENLDWESPIGQEVKRFYWSYYSVIILKMGEQNEAE